MSPFNQKGNSSVSLGVYVVVLVFLLWTCKGLAKLPDWVHRVKSCPDPNNISQWIAASRRLNCFYDLTSEKNDQSHVYHCLVSSYVNETVEFCGQNVPIAPGACPIYNYEVYENKFPTYYNCSMFTSGCPNQQTFSKKVYNYPECLRINRKEKCFEAETKCGLITTTKSTPVEQSEFADDFNKTSPLIIATIMLAVLLAIAIVSIIALTCFYRRRANEKNCKDVVSEHELKDLETTPDDGEKIYLGATEPLTIHDEETGKECSEEIDESSFLENPSGSSRIPTIEMIEKSPHRYDVERGTTCQCEVCVTKLNPYLEKTSESYAEEGT